MQVSRTLRWLQGNRPYRTLQIFRQFDEVTTSTGQKYISQHCQLQHAAPLFNLVRSPQYSTDKGQEIKASQSSASNEEDDFDIQELLTADNSQSGGGEADRYSRATYQKLTSAYKNLQAVNKEGERNTKKEKEYWSKKIRPWISDAVDSSLQHRAPPDMRLKCMAVLLHYEETGHLLSKVLKTTVSDARFMTIEAILDIVHLLSISKTHKRICRETRNDLVLVTVNNRWFEIGPKHILFFLYQLDELLNMKEICSKRRQQPDQSSTAETVNSSSPSEDFTSREVDIVNVENRLISLVDELKPRDMARVVTLMGKWRNRNQILLQALVHRLSLADMSDFSLFHLSNLLFACSILSIHNAQLLDKLSRELSSREIPTPTSVSSVLSSFSHLRWYSADVVSKCVTSLSNTNTTTQGAGQQLSSRESLNILMSLANLYAVPMSDEETAVIKSLAHRLSIDSISSVQKVDTAWCLAVLKLLDESMARTVLDPNFIQEFRGNEDFQSRNALQKLRGVSMAVRFELEGYDGPYMEESLLSAEPEKTERSAAQVVLSDALANALSKFVDMKTYVKAPPFVSGVFRADAVMCSDDSGNLKSLDNLENSDSGMHRVCIQAIPFNGVVTCDGQQTMTCGVHRMTARHLRHLGYVPVQIPYSELRPSQSVLEQVNAIQSRIKRAVCDHSTSSSIGDSEKDASSTTMPSTSSSTS